MSSRASLKATWAIARCHSKVIQLEGASLYAMRGWSIIPITNDIGRNEDYGEWGGMFSVVRASRDADGPVVEHIPSARTRQPHLPDSTRLFHPVIRVDLRVTFVRLVIAHVLLVSSRVS